MEKLSPLSVHEAIIRYNNSVSLARSKNTSRSYKNALYLFEQVLNQNGLETEKLSIKDLPEDSILYAVNALKDHSPATERLYITAINGFFEFLVADQLKEINLPRVKLLIRQRTRRPGQRLPQFPKELIDAILEKAITANNTHPPDKNENLRLMRDRAFIITLSDTGLRVHEACNLRRGDIDWNEGRAIIIGKGDRQGIIRFSKRSLKAIREYLSIRSELDSSTGRPLSSLPVFSRHDKGVGKKIKPITPTTGRNIISDWFKLLVLKDSTGKVTPHSFRHYFVTKVLQNSGNLKLAQELARHRNISVTQRYAHLADDELDRGFWNAIEEPDQSNSPESESGDKSISSV